MTDSLKTWTSTHKDIAGEEYDYHGNFNSELFEHWFEDLCGTLDSEVGPAIIHMDGARYHKRILNPAPSQSWTRDAIIEWLQDEGARNLSVG